MPDKVKIPNPLNNIRQDQITYLILAGGRGQRMNGVDKGLMHWQGRPMIEHIIKYVCAPADKIIISANRNLETYENYANTVISDEGINLNKDFNGPLAGILSAMQACTTPYLLCLPCDTPMPPENLLNILWQCLHTQNKQSALCHDGERLQPLFSLLSCQHKQLLNEFLQQGRRKVHDFFSLIDPAICDFSTQQNCFNNFNRPDDMS